ncbi:glycosyltransferase [Clostridium beijerinckii]|uniref:UDP:flavonoid glycosyltransferase YjiC (YdhE family) n=1 Tax=Clostridium beijerinckii TaxID=1520 RepID=A0A9Q5CQ65_CLOBE|nr:nucleotide disphospho-sugar-binding domain-containing protein [Clostridium beijerinckii]MBA2886008.1 UDP:flavonoid glycosyltransferase YjiC (YdhE family) [Clostridium beijerinckii]MBA2900704.1 UDP:flavonoid glycosyltransferase YjiC (YdhE family) [Clostridium beijerinckii]MBA2910567.1 UDP:flavonoid glycosyltransferase YjiC (YdhE family) [Clostridium beijerinckii]MBA9015412.1 UDP:flavonoid glycosyltransferase YjiC (YdhE family) [Clostridium beijerinckii]MBC2418471.1 glycosyl transferase [Clos
MKKILFTPGIASIEALGTITRLIAIADEIKKRQKDCIMIFRAAGREADYAVSSGYEVIQGYKPKFNIQELLQQDSNNDIKGNLSQPKFSIDSLCDVIRLKGLITKEYVQNTFKEEMELVQSFKPDLIFGEFETVMPIVAKKMDIPYFSTGSTIGKKDFCYYGFSNKTSYGYEEEYNKLLKSLNLKTIDNICELVSQEYNCNKVFVPSIPELEDLEDSSKYIYLGSVTPKNFIKSDFNFVKKRPLIYVYLSVGEIKPDVYQKVILDTFLGSEFDIIVTGGGTPQFKSDMSSNTSNVHFMDMVPSDKVIKMADIAIHHGGQNTTVQCIENEVPSIIFPGKHFERYFNAEKASEIGCALNPGINNFTKEFLLKACREIIKDNAFKQNLKIYSDQIKNYGGAAKAADFILNY